MIRGLPASLLLHAAVIGTGYIALPYAQPETQDIEIVPVDIVTVSEVTNVAAIVERRTEKPAAEEPTAPEPEPDIEDFLEDLDVLPEEAEEPVEEDVPPPPPDKVEEAKPEDLVPEEPEEKEPEPEEKEAEPEPEEKEPPRDALDDLLSENPFQSEDRVLIDKTARQKKAPPLPPAENLPNLEADQRGRRGAGEGTGAQARVQAIILAQVKVCWPDVIDLPDPERLQVTVKFNLKADGTLKDDVDLVRPRRAPIGDRFMGVAIDRALRAVRKCQPYSLPSEDYDIWQEVTVNLGTKS